MTNLTTKNVIRNVTKNLIKYNLTLLLLFCLNLVSCNKSSRKDDLKNPETGKSQGLPGSQVPDGVSSSNAQNLTPPPPPTTSTQGLQTPIVFSPPPGSADLLQKWEQTLRAIPLSSVGGLEDNVPLVAGCDYNGDSTIYWSCMYQKAYLSSALTAQTTRVKRFRCASWLSIINVSVFVYSYSGPKPPLSLACQVADDMSGSGFHTPLFISFSSEKECESNRLSRGLNDRLNYYKAEGYNCVASDKTNHTKPFTFGTEI